MREFKPRLVCMWTEEAAADLKARIADLDVKVVAGMEGLLEMAVMEEISVLVTAIVGMIGIRPTIAAIKAGKNIALANKETLVCAGHIIMPLAKEYGVSILPVDRVFFDAETEEDVTFKLTLNGLTFTGIEGLTEGTDYTYNADTATVILSKAFVNAKYAAMGTKYGTFADLVFKFSGGADWHEYLIKFAEPVMNVTSGTTADIKIPVDFKGSEVRRATAYMGEDRIGPNSSWWNYLQYGSAFLPDYEKGTIAILNGFWDDPTVVDGKITFHFEMYDGSVLKYTLEKAGTTVTGYPGTEAPTPTPTPAPSTQAPAPVQTSAPAVAVSPKTADAGNMLLWLALMAVAAGSAVVLTKKREENL